MFDHWDHTLETGSDTEYALVVVALCVGVVYTLARLITMLARELLSASVDSNLPCIEGSTLFLMYPLAQVPAPGSPPLNLRI